MLTIAGFLFNTLTFSYFYDSFVRRFRMKISEKHKAIGIEIQGVSALLGVYTY